jgi:hypothetical protein
MINLDTNIVNSVSSLIQLAVAPVFLLAGVAGLLNVFTGRLARIIDKLERLDVIEAGIRKKDPNYLLSHKEKKRRVFLSIRMENTNLAIFFCTCTGLLVALVIVTMFLSAFLEFDGSVLISIFFIFAMFCLISSLIVFLKEIFYTTSFIRTKKYKYIKEPNN